MVALQAQGDGAHKSGFVDLGKVAGDPGASGVRIDRAKTFYDPDPNEAASLFTGYPAPRPWFPFGTHGNYQEVIPSIRDEYPYPDQGVDNLLECVALFCSRSEEGLGGDDGRNGGW